MRPREISTLRIVGVLAAVMLSDCRTTTLRVGLKYDPSADFSVYRTYDWVSGSKASPVSATEQAQLFDRRVRAAVENTFAAKGFLRQMSATPDFLVGYRVSIRDTKIDTIADFYVYREAGGSANLIDAYITGYEQGTLQIEILDARSGRAVWRASVHAAIDPAQREDQANQAISEMLERFPPH